jgi:hypothetical protein
VRDTISVDGIDINIQILFKAEYLRLLIPQFKRAGIIDTDIDEMIDAFIRSGELVSFSKWILTYGQAVLNPIMNKNLNRPPNHPTFNNLLKFALKEFLEIDTTISHLNNSKKILLTNRKNESSK